MIRTGPGVTPYFHWAHTIAGLDYLAQGQTDQAAEELSLSLKQIPDQFFMLSMALASALVGRRSDAVVAYLDNLSGAQGWSNRAQAAIWKAQVQAGQTPNFGALSHLGL